MGSRVKHENDGKARGHGFPCRGTRMTGGRGGAVPLSNSPPQTRERTLEAMTEWRGK